MPKIGRHVLVFNYIIPALCFFSPILGVWGIIPFFLICLHIFIDLTYQGFMRRSRFALSRHYPALNRVFNGIILFLPFTSFLFQGLGAMFFMPFLLGIHMFSEIRSPDPETAGKPRAERPIFIYFAWLLMYLVGLAAAFLAVATDMG